MIGTTLGHYKIIGKLGHGGMGEVFRAEDTKLKREVALKVLPSDLSDDEERLTRFQREAESIAALNHPNIVTIYSVEEDDGTHFLTMELVGGKSLDKIIQKNGLPLDEVFDIAVPLADALSSAHEKGIVHRDLKPANVMVSEEGRVKILDFGLAKLLQEPDEAPSADDQATEALTQEGRILGTIPYMSPEQVQGRELDARSDIFSLGIILYEMVTGDRPFAGDTSADLISAILRDTPDSASEVKMDLPHHLGRIIRHCMEKNPKRRYQSALDVRNELEGLRQEIASGMVHTESAVLAAAKPGGRPKWLLPAVAGVVALLLVFALWRFLAPSEESAPADAAPVSAAAPAEPSEPSVAVLYFDNLSGDAELEWLRKGLTDMLVTDLSQSPDLRVLSTDRLYQILSDMKKLDERSTSFETVRAVAEEAGADTVILGSYAKLGDTIRISYKIQEASTGEILKAQSADASAQEELFARVDELSREIRQSLELPEQPTAVADRDLTDVSTSSVEAYRYFVEAEELHYQFKEEEALVLYTKAVEADPTFAMALAKISTTTNNLGREGESLAYAERAMEHLDRLTEPERAYVEGRYYGRTLETIGKAIETYEYTLANYPHITSLSNNLGILYSSVGLLDEAIATLEQGIRYGDTFPGSHSTLAEVYFARGDVDRAHQVVDEYLSRFPESFPLFGTRSEFYAQEGRLGEAVEALEEGESLRPGYFGWLFGRYSLAILQEDWRAAEQAANRFGQIPAPFATSAEIAFLFQISTYQGQAVDVSAAAERSIASYPAPGAPRANSYANWGVALFEMGSHEKALEYAHKARQEGRGDEPDLLAHGLEVLAQQQLGQERRADLLAEELTGRVEAIPGPEGKSWAGEIRGRLALMRGDTTTAIAELEQVEENRPPNDEDNIGVWFHLGTAFLEAGRLADAQTRFERIVSSHGDRIFSPREYVRSYYLLGQIHEQQGDTAEARDSYQQFLAYWGDGDLDRERLDHARQFLAKS